MRLMEGEMVEMVDSVYTLKGKTKGFPVKLEININNCHKG